MPRIPYRPADLAEPAALVESIRARRGGTLLNLDRMLLHSPPIARGWNAFFGEVRGNLELPPRLRELAMCLVALLNGADYEFRHHAPEFIKAGGTVEQLEALRSGEYDGAGAASFDAAARAAIALTVDMTKNVRVSDDVFASVREALDSDRLVIELVGVIAAYNMVSRVLVALGIEPEEDVRSGGDE